MVWWPMILFGMYRALALVTRARFVTPGHASGAARTVSVMLLASPAPMRYGRRSGSVPVTVIGPAVAAPPARYGVNPGRAR